MKRTALSQSVKQSVTNKLKKSKEDALIRSTNYCTNMLKKQTGCFELFSLWQSLSHTTTPRISSKSIVPLFIQHVQKVLKGTLFNKAEFIPSEFYDTYFTKEDIETAMISFNDIIQNPNIKISPAIRKKTSITSFFIHPRGSKTYPLFVNSPFLFSLLPEENTAPSVKQTIITLYTENDLIHPKDSMFVNNVITDAKLIMAMTKKDIQKWKHIAIAIHNKLPIEFISGKDFCVPDYVCRNEHACMYANLILNDILKHKKQRAIEAVTAPYFINTWIPYYFYKKNIRPFLQDTPTIYFQKKHDIPLKSLPSKETIILKNA
jgi:hypothetical protein